MNFKRYIESSNSWVDSHYIKGTDTETITTLPATIYPLAQSVTLSLKGQTVQNGTPSPSNPVDVVGVGEQTANLYDKTNPDIFTGYYDSGNNRFASTPNNAFVVVPIVANATYYVQGIKRASASATVRYCTSAEHPAHGVSVLRTGTFTQSDGLTLTGDTGENYLALFACGDSDYSAYGSVNAAIAANGANLVIDNGYKIPISCGQQTTDLYLGQVQTTRTIKKLVLDGTENFTAHASIANLFRLDITDYRFSESNITLCTHYQSINNTGAAGVSNNNICFYYGSSTARIMYIMDSNYSTAADFKAYLAAQYAAGTPVTVYYLLATAETGTVNEPLMKISTYADSISGISISTTAGANTLDVQTTVKPSEVSAAFNGWHPISAVHERSGGSWT